MTSKEFVIAKIKDLVNENPHIKCIYEFDEFEMMHYVLIKPREFFNNDDLGFNGEEGIIIEFTEKYPLEGLIFISEEDEILLSNPLYTEEGFLYEIYNLSIDYNFADLDELFDNFSSELPDKEISLLNMSENNALDIDGEIHIAFHSNDNFMLYQQYEDIEETLIPANDNYSKAA